MKEMKRGLAWAVLLAVSIASGCEPASPATPSRSVSWQGLSEAQAVYGIVRLAVKVNGNGVEEVRFYQDSPDGEHLIAVAAPENGPVYAADWHTLETVNGDHVLYAVVTFHDGSSSQSPLAVKVGNRSRADSIPASAIKMTPAKDKAPPHLAPAFKDYWYDPVPLEGPVNTAGAEDSPFITPDGNTLYFWFNGDEMKDVHEQVEDPMTGIYWSKRVDGRWQEPQRLFLQYFDRIGFDGAETVRGNVLWFASIREGNYRDIDFWTAELVNGRWVRWANAGELLNKVYQVSELHVTADGNEIYFDSKRAGGKGEKDIWVTRNVNGAWQEPQNIEAVNTAGDEGWPFISEDGTELWFTRATPGPAIFRSIKVDGKWQTPEMVVSALAGEPTLDAAGNLYFAHHRWDDTLNRVTEADIYVCRRRG
ncbi:MAG: hypothetical protein AB1603_08275 [Chloroflexota bacterium]